jgi:amino acid transporter
MTAVENVRPGSLKRHLSLTGAVMLTLSVVTPASSMFIIIPGVIGQAGTGVIISLALAGFLGLIVALVYAELASIYGSAGGEYVYVEKIFGEAVAYPVIIVNVITQTFITSVLAIGAGEYFQRIVPIDPTTSAVIVVVFATLFGVLRIRTNAVITGLFFITELAALVAVSYFGAKNINNSLGVIAHPLVLSGSKLISTPAVSIAMATAAALFAFNGYENSIYLNEELEGSKLTIAHAILISFFFGILLETTPTILTLLASKDLAHFANPNVNPYLDLAKRVAGPRAVTFISAAISIAVLNACIANVLLTARFVFSTARSKAWGTVVERYGTILGERQVPVAATIFVGLLGAIACFLPITWLFVLTGTGLVFIYATLCIALIVHRRRSKTHSLKEDKGAFRVPFAQIWSAIGFVGLLGVLVANWVDPVLGRPSTKASIVEIVAGLAIWFALRKIASKPPLHSNIHSKLD